MHRLTYILLLILCAMASCVRTTVNLSADIDPGGWEPGEVYSLVFDNSDTVARREISIFVVYNDLLTAAGASLPLVVTVTTPDSTAFSEEWTFHPDPETSGTVIWHEGRRPYRSEVVFDQRGPYTFGFGHLSKDIVTGVKAIGLTVE